MDKICTSTKSNFCLHPRDTYFRRLSISAEASLSKFKRTPTIKNSPLQGLEALVEAEAQSEAGPLATLSHIG